MEPEEARAKKKDPMRVKITMITTHVQWLLSLEINTCSSLFSLHHAHQEEVFRVCIDRMLACQLFNYVHFNHMEHIERKIS